VPESAERREWGKRQKTKRKDSNGGRAMEREIEELRPEKENKASECPMKHPCLVSCFKVQMGRLPNN